MGISILWNWFNCTPFSNKLVGGTRTVYRQKWAVCWFLPVEFQFCASEPVWRHPRLGYRSAWPIQTPQIDREVAPWHPNIPAISGLFSTEGSLLKKGKTWSWCGNFQVLRSADLGLKVSRWVESNADAYPKLLGARAKHSGPRYGIHVSRLFREKGFKQGPHHILWVQESIGPSIGLPYISPCSMA